MKNLHHQAGDFTVWIDQWSISDNGVTALIGPSGSGKSTILRCLMGLNACATMSWEFQGTDLAKLPVEKRCLGVVFQENTLFPHLNARENVVFAARSRGLARSEIDARVERLADALEIRQCLDRSAKVLSGGEAQRVSLCRALIGKPRILLLDEPFSSLDRNRREKAIDLVVRVAQEFQIPVLLVSHDQEDVRRLDAKDIIEVENGRIVKTRK